MGAMAERGLEWLFWQLHKTLPYLLAASNISEFITFTGISEHTHRVWAKCGKSLFGTDRDVTLCAVYIPPENRDDRSETENMCAHFGDEVQTSPSEVNSPSSDRLTTSHSVRGF